MKDLFKQLLVDFETFEKPRGVVRDVIIPEMPPQVRKAITFIGMRRSGKTWILYQNLEEEISVPEGMMYLFGSSCCVS